jgi:hypothetical protein
MKIKFNQAQIDRLEKNVRERLTKVVEDKSLLFEVGEMAKKLIQMTVRMGKSPLTGSGFDKLSDGWKKQRVNLEPKDPAFRPNKSNLTVSGQLMKSIMHRSYRNVVELFFDGKHSTYTRKKTPYRISKKRNVQSGFMLRTKSKSGSTIVGKEIDNADLARYVAERGRPFFGFNKFFKEKLMIQVKKVVIRYIRRNI